MFLVSHICSEYIWKFFHSTIAESAYLDILLWIPILLIDFVQKVKRTRRWIVEKRKCCEPYESSDRERKNDRLFL